MRIDIGIQQIEGHFSDFIDGGLHLVNSKVDHKSFGNWIAVYQADRYILKFIQTQGTISVSISPSWASIEPSNFEHFINLELLIDFSKNIQFIVSNPKYEEYDIDKSLRILSNLLRDNFQNLLAILENDDFLKTEEAVNNYHEQRLKKLYGIG